MNLNDLKNILSISKFDENYFDCFVETGTYLGETLNNLKNNFSTLVSIEITDYYYEICKKKFRSDKNIFLKKNDCIDELPLVIEEFKDKNILFFLDGHYSSGNTGKGKFEVPLIQELKIINEKYKKRCIVVIDDADLFDVVGHEINWNNINEGTLLNCVVDRVENFFYSPLDSTKDKKRLVLIFK